MFTVKWLHSLDAITFEQLQFLCFSILQKKIVCASVQQFNI